MRRRFGRGSGGPGESGVWAQGDALFCRDVNRIVRDEWLTVYVGAVGRAEVFDFEMAVGILVEAAVTRGDGGLVYDYFARCEASY